MGYMRPPAEIHKLPLPVEGNGAVREVLDHLQLVGLIFVKGKRLRFGDAFPSNRQLLLDDFLHLGLDLGKILFGNRIHIDIVVESVLDHGADGQLGGVVEPQNGLRHDMSRAVAHDLQSFVLTGGDQAQGGILVNGQIEVPQLAVDFHGDAIARQPFGNGLRHVQPGGRGFKLLYAPVRKCYIDHRVLASSWQSCMPQHANAVNLEI